MRRAILKITDKMLVDLFSLLENDSKYAFKIVKNGLPKDAKPVRCMILNEGLLGILIESEEFDEAVEEYPVLNSPTIEKKYIDDK